MTLDFKPLDVNADTQKEIKISHLSASEECCTKITEMHIFQGTCRALMWHWFNSHRNISVTHDDIFVVWSCKALQNFKCLCSTNAPGDTTYAEFTYNGDKGEIYCDYYTKEENVVVKL